MDARKCLLLVLLASMPSIAVASRKAAEMRELEANRQKWRRHAVTTYQFRLRDETCYCLYGPYYGPIRVSVKNGKVRKAVYEGERRDGYWYGRIVREKTHLVATVEDVFTQVEQLITSGAQGAPYKIRYDRVYGFPTLVDVDNPPRMADAQWRLVVDGFKPMSVPSKNSKAMPFRQAQGAPSVAVAHLVLVRCFER
jgi:hypothetical protein